MVTEDTLKITGDTCAKTNQLFSYSSEIFRDWISSKTKFALMYFGSFCLSHCIKKILINKPGSQFSTINKLYVQATVAFMSVRCKSKFTSYVKHYTRREKQGWFLVLKDICVSIKSASCVLNTAGWSYSDQMAFLSQPGDLSVSTVFQNRICSRELWGKAGQAPALLPVLWEPNFPAVRAVEQRGSCQVPRGSRMARTEPKLELCFCSREPGSLLEFGHQKEMKKEEKTQLC